MSKNIFARMLAALQRMPTQPQMTYWKPPKPWQPTLLRHMLHGIYAPTIKQMM